MIFEDIQRIIHEDLGEKVVASLVLSDEGNLIIQYGDKIIIYKNAVSARPASELLKIVADFIN